MVWRRCAPRSWRSALVIALAIVLGSAGQASAGGAGCHSTAISDKRGVSVTVEGFCFEPTVLRVPAGETVTWTNEDDSPHLVSGVNGTWRIDEQFGLRESVSAQLDEPGVYPYWCPLHPGMLGTVVVEDRSGSGVLAASAGGSPAGWGALGAAVAVALMSVGMVVWRRRENLMSRSG